MASQRRHGNNVYSEEIMKTFRDVEYIYFLLSLVDDGGGRDMYRRINVAMSMLSGKYPSEVIETFLLSLSNKVSQGRET
jgi:hypothetical protein